MATNNRTLLSTVVFLDVVGYTNRSVFQQLEIKQHLTKHLSSALERIPEDERIVCDTGDGAAICFLVDPEEALFFALNMRDLLLENEAGGGYGYQVRFGVNLGPIKVIRDVNGRRNTIGDGINIASRVMNFAGPNQVYVSRSFYEVIGCLSAEYGKLFSHRGIHTDKHVREYDVYEVGADRDGSDPEAPPDEVVDADAGQPQNLAEKPLSTPAPVAAWQQRDMEQVARALAHYIGPIATVLVRKTCHDATDCGELVDRLADTIGSEAERQEFRAGLAGLLRAHREMERAQPSASSEPVAIAGGATLDQKSIDAVSAALAKFLGPVAKIMVKRKAKQASSRTDLCRILAEELATEEERRAFLQASGPGD